MNNSISHLFPHWLFVLFKVCFLVGSVFIFIQYIIIGIKELGVELEEIRLVSTEMGTCIKNASYKMNQSFNWPPYNFKSKLIKSISKKDDLCMANFDVVCSTLLGPLRHGIMVIVPRGSNLSNGKHCKMCTVSSCFENGVGKYHFTRVALVNWRLNKHH